MTFTSKRILIFLPVLQTIIFPYYLFLLKDSQDDWLLFVWLFAVFSFATTLTASTIGRWIETLPPLKVITLCALGWSLLFAILPSTHSTSALFLFQVALGAVQTCFRLAEKRLPQQLQWSHAYYIGVTSLWTGIAFILFGHLSIIRFDYLFYTVSALYASSVFLLWKQN